MRRAFVLASAALVFAAFACSTFSSGDADGVTANGDGAEAAVPDAATEAVTPVDAGGDSQVVPGCDAAAPLLEPFVTTDAGVTLVATDSVTVFWAGTSSKTIQKQRADGTGGVIDVA